MVLLLLLFIGLNPAYTITEDEVVESLVLVSTSLKGLGGDIETLTEDWKTDSANQNLRLDSLEQGLSEIESVSVDLKELPSELETLQINWTNSFDEYKQKELIEDVVQWTIITVLSAYLVKDIWGFK